MGNKEILNRLTENDDSSFIERARKKSQDAPWLRKSTRIAVRVLSRLKELGMSQKELAEKLKVTPQYVSKIVKGNENLTLETICGLETALGITLIETRINSVISTYEPQKKTTYGEPKVISFNAHCSGSIGFDIYSSIKDTDTTKSA